MVCSAHNILQKNIQNSFTLNDQDQPQLLALVLFGIHTQTTSNKMHWDFILFSSSYLNFIFFYSV